MILLPQHKGEEKEAIVHQLVGWIFESHLWVPEDATKGITPATCQWCGEKTEYDIDECIKRDIEVKLCKSNPLSVFETAQQYLAE